MLRKRADSETGEYHAWALEALTRSGVLVSSATEVRFASDLIAEFVMARRLMQDGELQTRADFSRFAAQRSAKRKRVPTNLGVLAFVAARFARDGIELWSDIDFELEGYEDWLAQVNYLVGPAETTESLVRALFQNNLRRMQQFVAALPGSNPLLLETDLDTPSDYLFPANDLGQADTASSVAIPSRSLTYRVHEGRWKRDDLPDEVKPDFDFWFRDLPVQMIPRLASPDMPSEARRLLIRACIRLCANRSVPSELTEAIYVPLARSFAEAGGTLAEDELMELLLCDDDLFDARSLLSAFAWAPGMEWAQDLVRLECVAHGDTALRLLNEQRWSLLMIDEIHPGPSGIEVVRQFRAEGPTEWCTSTSIVFVTGFGPEAKGFSDSDADAYFSKPFLVEDFWKMMLGYGARDQHHLKALQTRFLAIVAQTE